MILTIDVVSLPLNQDAGTPSGINEKGDIVGYYNAGLYGQALAIQNGIMTTLPTLGGASGGAGGINNEGEIVGSSRTSSGAEHATLWVNGQPTDLNTGNWVGSWATGINDQGVIAGNVDITSILRDQAEIWQNGVATSLGNLGGTWSVAYGINNANQIFGMAATASGQTHAFLWQNGAMSDLGTLGGTTSYANGINSSGEVVGSANTAQGSSHPVLWRNGTVLDLGSLGGGSGSANGIDDGGTVVGSSLTSSYVTHAFLWQDGVMIDLNVLLPTGSQWVLTSASFISDSGLIVGLGSYKGDTGSAFSISLPTTNLAVSVHTALTDSQDSTVGGKLYIGDSPANITASLDALQSLAAAGEIGGIGFSDAGSHILTVSQAQLTADSSALYDLQGSFSLMVTGVSAAQASTVAREASVTSVAVRDSASDVVGLLGSLNSLAAGGHISSITLTDGGIPNLTLAAAMLSADQAALNAISSDYTITVTADTSTPAIDGIAGRGMIVSIPGNASQYTVVSGGDGESFALNGLPGDYTIKNATELQFADHSDFVASATAPSGGISSSQITTLYAAVFSRTPDVPGLAYYEAAASQSPSIGIVTYAEQFLQSPEYTGNAAHNYAQTSLGDAQFISDTYSNLLHRSPEANAVSWYQANVISPMLTGLTSGTSAYTEAELLAHATVLADFSASAEFFGDVQITAQHPADAQHWLILI